MSDNIILTGFMGAGKTSVGRLVAQTLGREFVDMDELIATRAGKPVAQIFSEDGAPSFRARESALCRELALRSNLVIATGGGALVDDANRAALAVGARVFCLDVSPVEIERRVGAVASRPLLVARPAGQPVGARIAELLREREAAYALIPYHICTDRLSIAQVAAQVVVQTASEATRELEREVRAGSEVYQVVLGAGTWRQVGVLLRARLPKTQRAAIVSDEIVGPLYAAIIEQSLARAGFQSTLITMPASESAKTLETVSMLYDRFVEAQLERTSVVLALGGGLVGDVAGFAAATYMRGVHFVQLPTTVLSVVDASLGGKTAVNHAQGKNLIGAFKQPVLVCADREALAALPVAELRSGLAEVVKHGILGDRALFERIERDGLRDLPRILADAIEVKLKVIESDPHEHAERAVLNLGHTFGHAFETLSHYTIRHGEAVALGLVAAARLSARLELCDPALATRIESLLARLNLPTAYSQFDAQATLAVMRNDKKKEQGKIRFVLPIALGQVIIRNDVDQSEVASILQSGL